MPNDDCGAVKIGKKIASIGSERKHVQSMRFLHARVGFATASPAAKIKSGLLNCTWMLKIWIKT